jgi:hypothetical protein
MLADFFGLGVFVVDVLAVLIMDANDGAGMVSEASEESESEKRDVTWSSFPRSQ